MYSSTVFSIYGYCLYKSRTWPNTFVIRQTQHARLRNVAEGSIVIKFRFVNSLQTNYLLNTTLDQILHLEDPSVL